jgi:hypothetical protein
MKGYEVFYNFVRKHQAIGKTPSELATDIKLNGNKWLELIYLSNKNRTAINESSNVEKALFSSS